MIRVLHVIDHLGLGGAQSALLDLVRSAEPDAVFNEVAVLHGRGPFYEALVRAGVPVHSLSQRRWPPGYLLSLPRLLAAGRFDIVHFHLQASNWLAKPLSALSCDLPRIAHDHTSGDLRFRGVGSLLPDALTHLWSHRVIAVSPGVRDFLCRWEGLPTDSVAVIANGIDTGAFHPPSPAGRAAARVRFGLDAGAFVVGAMGRLSPEKNFAALAAIAGALPDAMILVGGDGPLRAGLEAEFQRYGGRVRLCGRVDERETFYAALDVFVLPSLFEGLPMVLLEAMASGVPPVASRLPDIAAALGSGGGILVTPGDAQGLAAAVTSLANDPEQRRAIADVARTVCEREFSARRMAREVARVYGEVRQRVRPGMAGVSHL